MTRGRHELPAGEDTINHVRVRRFPVAHARSTDDFGRRSQLVFERAHSIADEIAWLDSEGPTSRALIQYIQRVRNDFDFFVFFARFVAVRREPQTAEPAETR